MNIEPEAYAEVLKRLRKLRDLAAELAEAFVDPVSRCGAEEMRDSLERVLDLLGVRE